MAASKNLHFDSCLVGARVKNDTSILNMHVVDTRLSILVVITKLDRSIPHCDFAVATVSTLEVDSRDLLVRTDLCGAVFLLERNIARLVIINNSDASLSVSTLEQHVRIGIGQLHEEVSIGVPIIIILNLDLNILLSLTLREIENRVDRNVVFVLLCFTLKCGHGNSALLARLVQNWYLDLAESLRYRIVKALEAEVGVQVRLVLKVRSVSMLELELLALGNCPIISNCDGGLAILKTGNERLFVELLLELLERNLRDIGRFEVLLEDLLHLLALSHVFGRLLLALLLFLQKSRVHLSSGERNI